MSDPKGTWLKVFCPDARCLGEEEVMALPQDARQAAGGKEGLWLELFCPDQQCLTEEVAGVRVRAEGGGDKWLDVFCPQGACLAKNDGTEIV